MEPDNYTIKMENSDTFDILVIKQGSIKSISWIDPLYAFKLIELDLFESIKTNVDSFLTNISVGLCVKKYDVKDLHVKTEIIGEEPGYLYELFYIDLEKEPKYHNDNNLNELASLINTNGDQIYSPAIIFRNHLPSLSDSMTLCDMTKYDLAQMLHNRVHTKIVMYDDKWIEDTCVGDLNVLAQVFFDSEQYEKIEIPFLMHNINIWYTTNGEQPNDLCGKLLNKSIDKCIWFTMKSDEYRGSLSLSEVNKIIYLSKILTNYQTPSFLTEERNDNLGRKIVYNKYKVLDYVYNDNQNI